MDSEWWEVKGIAECGLGNAEGVAQLDFRFWIVDLESLLTRS